MRTHTARGWAMVCRCLARRGAGKRWPALLAVLLAAGTWSARGEAVPGAGPRGAAPAENAPVPGTTAVRPLPGHPGNVFLHGEDVAVAVPAEAAAAAARWLLLDDRGDTLAEGELPRGAQGEPERIALGRLGVGWYRIELRDRDGGLAGWTAAAVLAPLAAPVPSDSPVAVDSATAWFARNDPGHQERLARMAALAGASWVRDRMRWADIQPGPDRFAAEPTTYDTAASIQAGNGLGILQVFHDTPEWAVAEGESRGRFPRDLRHVHSFCRAMAERFRGRVAAWEPWNEANIAVFGGQTVDEMCSYQKAAYLGFKAGDPVLIVGWNAYAGPPTGFHTAGLLANETWPYFDTYNIHSYDWPHSYEALWAPAREAACGRPLWLTESDRGMRRETGPPWFELPLEGERRKAELMAQEYSYSLFSGVSRHFHFILGHYTEEWNQVQFGLLRLDLTPRPAYVALAAVGRFLAGARSLGRWTGAAGADAHVFAFRARPNGQPADVLVAWAEREVDWPERGRAEAAWPLPAELPIRAVHDYLGRELAPRPPARLTPAACFVTLPEHGADSLALTPPARPRPHRSGTPPPVVLQLLARNLETVKIEERPWSEGYERRAAPGVPVELLIDVYNFAEGPVRGSVEIEHAPEGVLITPKRWDVAVAAGETVRIAATATCAPGSEPARERDWIVLRGAMAEAGRPVLAFRLLP